MADILLVHARMVLLKYMVYQNDLLLILYIIMKQNDVFTKRDTQRIVNNLTCHESQHSSAMYIYKMKEITAVYK